MKLLLDTHVFLWWRTDNARLKRDARKAISTAEVVDQRGFRLGSRHQAGFGSCIEESFASMVRDSQFDELSITLEHAERAGSPPPHHADPSIGC